MTIDQANELISRIRKHIQTEYLSYEEILKLYEIIPEHAKYEGKAYRIIINIPQNEISHEISKNLYWTKFIDGLTHYQNNSFKDVKQSNTILESNVVGIDLNALIIYLNSICIDNSSFNNPYENEHEILIIRYGFLNII